MAYRIEVEYTDTFGLNGLRGRSYNHGDQWEFRPYGMATVLFASVVY